MGLAPRNPNGWWKRGCAVWFSTDWQRQSGSQHASLKVTRTSSCACSLRGALSPGAVSLLSPVSHLDSCFQPSNKSECLFLPFFPSFLPFSSLPSFLFFFSVFLSHRWGKEPFSYWIWVILGEAGFLSSFHDVYITLRLPVTFSTFPACEERIRKTDKWESEALLSRAVWQNTLFLSQRLSC